MSLSVPACRFVSKQSFEHSPNTNYAECNRLNVVALIDSTFRLSPVCMLSSTASCFVSVHVLTVIQPSEVRCAVCFPILFVTLHTRYLNLTMAIKIESHCRHLAGADEKRTNRIHSYTQHLLLTASSLFDQLNLKLIRFAFRLTVGGGRRGRKRRVREMCPIT